LRETGEVLHDLGSAGILFQNNVQDSQRNKMMNSPTREIIDFNEVVKLPHTAVKQNHLNT